LGEKADAAAARQLDRPVIRFEDAAYQVEQGRLAGAVAADETDLAPLGDVGIRQIEQSAAGLAADAVGHAGKDQHLSLLPYSHGFGR
jgi:hypothetical protein